MKEREKIIKKKYIKLRNLVFTELAGTIRGSIYVIFGWPIEQAGAGVPFSILKFGILIVLLVQNYVKCPYLKRQCKTIFYPFVPILTGMIYLILIVYIAPKGF